MASFNKVILMGNLTRDPELRVTSNGAQICKFGMAMSRKYKAGDEMREETTFVDVDAFGRTAEVVAQYFKKGRPIMVEGRLKFDQWEGQDGQKRSKLAVVLENFQFVGSNGGEEGGNNYQQSSPPVRQTQQAAAPAASNDFDEDVPF